MTDKTAKSKRPVTRQKLLDASVKLMRIKGFNATSVEDICDAADVTKGGFFHYFHSKQAVAKAAVEHYRQARQQAFEQASFRKLADPLERVYGRLNFIKNDLLESVQVTGGCLLGMLAQELAITHPLLRQTCQNAFLNMTLEFEKDLSAAKTRYAPQADFDPKKLANLFMAIYQGSLLLAKTAESHTIMEENFDQFARLLAGLFNRASQPLPVITDPSSDHSRN